MTLPTMWNLQLHRECAVTLYSTISLLCTTLYSANQMQTLHP